MAEICEDVKKYLEDAGYTVEEKNGALKGTLEGARANWVVDIVPGTETQVKQAGPANQVTPNDQVWMNAHQHQNTGDQAAKSGEQQQTEINLNTTKEQKDIAAQPAGVVHANTLPEGTDQIVHNPKYAPVTTPAQHKLNLTWTPNKDEKKEEPKKEEGKEEGKKDDKKKEEPKKEEGKKAKKVSGDKGEDKKKERVAYTREFTFTDFESFKRIMETGVLDVMTEEVENDDEASDEEINTVLERMSEAEASSNVPFLAKVLLRMRGGDKE